MYFVQNTMWFIVFIGLVAFSGKPVRALCPLLMTPSNPVVKYGDPLLVNCTSLTDQTKGMGWEASYQGTPKQDGVTFVVLNISSLTTWDIYTECYMNLVGGSQCSEELHVTVYQMPETVSMSLLAQDSAMLEGRVYRMQCDIVNVAPAKHLKVVWYKGAELSHTDTFDEVSSVKPVNLLRPFELTAQREDNGKRIWCEAALNFEPLGPNLPRMKSNSHEMIVHYPPTFTLPEEEIVELPAGGKINLNCTAAGNPMPVYRWEVPDLMQEKVGNQPILTPLDPLPGTYNCTASNSQGTKTKSFRVIDAPRDQTILAAVVGVVAALGAVALIAGLYFVKSDGTFPCGNPQYQPTSSGAV